jgi:hypothetical protein
MSWVMSVKHHFQQYYVRNIMRVSIIGGGKPEYQEKITDLPQVTDKLYHITFCIKKHSAMDRNQIPN